MKLNDLKEYIKRRIRHAESRYNLLKECHGDNPAEHYNYYGGQTLGYWQGMIAAYGNMLDMIEATGEKYTIDSLKYCSCGGEPKIVYSKCPMDIKESIKKYWRNGWYVYCKNCSIAVMCENKSDAIDKWNDMQNCNK